MKTVTMSLNEFDALRNSIKRQQEEINELYRDIELVFSITSDQLKTRAREIRDCRNSIAAFNMAMQGKKQ